MAGSRLGNPARADLEIAMGDKSKIEWTDATWNPMRGCSRVSKGCEHCYAEPIAHRFNGPGEPYAGLTRMTEHGPVWTGEVRLVPELLDQPLRWKRRRRIFVNSMSDLFHEKVPFNFIRTIFKIMGEASQHIFQVLTKRPERMRDFVQRFVSEGDFPTLSGSTELPFPWRNIWLGVSCEDQKTFDGRWPYLRDTPAAIRFISYEPALGPVDISRHISETHICADCGHRSPWRKRPVDDKNNKICPACGSPHCDEQDSHDDIDWIIVGGESGPHARPMNPEWPKSIRDQCQAAGVPFFFKQWGEWIPVGEVSDHPYPDPGIYHDWDDGTVSARYGKKRAGRFLDGREWKEYPIAGERHGDLSAAHNPDSAG